MREELWKQVYLSLTAHVLEPYRVPGVEDAFADSAYCMLRYREIRDAIEMKK